MSEDLPEERLYEVLDACIESLKHGSANLQGLHVLLHGILKHLGFERTAAGRETDDDQDTDKSQADEKSLSRTREQNVALEQSPSGALVGSDTREPLKDGHVKGSRVNTPFSHPVF